MTNLKPQLYYVNANGVEFGFPASSEEEAATMTAEILRPDVFFRSATPGEWTFLVQGDPVVVHVQLQE